MAALTVARAPSPGTTTFRTTDTRTTPVQAPVTTTKAAGARST